MAFCRRRSVAIDSLERDPWQPAGLDQDVAFVELRDELRPALHEDSAREHEEEKADQERDRAVADGPVEEGPIEAVDLAQDPGLLAVRAGRTR